MSDKKSFDVYELKEDTMMTKEDVAAYLNIGETSVWKLMNYPGFPYTQIGRKKQVRFKDLCEFLEQNKGSKVDISCRQRKLLDPIITETSNQKDRQSSESVIAKRKM